MLKNLQNIKYISINILLFIKIFLTLYLGFENKNYPYI